MNPAIAAMNHIAHNLCPNPNASSNHNMNPNPNMNRNANPDTTYRPTFNPTAWATRTFILAICLGLSGCANHQKPVATAPDSRQPAPAAKPSPANSPETYPTPDSAPGPRIEPLTADFDIPRWVWPVAAKDHHHGAWVTGNAQPGNRIVIETHNVQSFTIAMDRLPVDWSRRVILKIDGHTSELTRKHYPRLRLTRSPTGGWVSSADTP